MHNSPGIKSFRNWGAIAHVTYREIARDKIFYTSLFAAVLLLLFGLLASQLSFLTQERVIRDFGLSALRFASGATGISFAANLLARELERRTAFVVLARPIPRVDFLIGKYLGLTLILLMNGLLLSFTYWGLLAASGGSLSLPVVYASLLALLEALVIAALSLCISVRTTPTLTVLYSIGLWIIGGSVTELRMLFAKIPVLEKLSAYIPSLEPFHLGLRVTYELPIPGIEVAGAFGYALLLILSLLALSGLLFQRKEI